MHPSLDSLVAFCDGEYGSRRVRQITRHLAACEKCRDRVRLVHSEKVALSHRAPPASADTQKGLACLLSAMTNWRANPDTPGASRLRNRLRDQIETYFGAPALAGWDRPDISAEELLGRTSVLLEVFLGPAAAEAVKDDVLAGLGYPKSEVCR